MNSEVANTLTTTGSLECRLASRLGQVDQVCRDLRDFLARHGLAAAAFGIELATRECLNNAILHGNAHDASRFVDFSLRLGRRWLRVMVADQGRGFDWRSRFLRVPDDSRTCGRGFPILSLYARRVSFNRCGNAVTLWFDRRHPVPLTAHDSP